MKKMIWLLLLCLPPLSALAGCSPASTPIPTALPTIAATLAAGDSERTVAVDGAQRTYLLHIPPGLPSGKPLPVVMVFHGLFANAEYARQVTGFNDIADAHGFLVAYPNGSGSNPDNLSFNAGPCCGDAAQQNIDDEAFVRKILSDLESIASIDTRRIYATGWDNGAFFTFRLGCEMSETFAAIGTMNGSLPYNPCRPKQPVSVIHLHGLKDISIPYAGGGRVFGTTDGVYPPARDMIGEWAKRDGCSDNAQETQKGLVTRIVFDGCPAGLGVEIDALSGIAHSWPSAFAVPASEMIWNFFAAHPRP
jgi:polyhydroxybutyrate depolymerase